MSATATLDDVAAAGGTEHFDVLIVGAGISGVGGAYHLQQQCPDRQLRGARGARELRRHLADAQVPGHPLRQRPVHLRLPLQAVDRAHRSPPPRRSSSTWARSSTRTTSAEHIRYQHRITHGAPGRAPTTCGRIDATDTDTGEPSGASPPTSCGCARATTATPRATRPSGRAWTATRARSCTRRPGPRTSTTRGKNVIVHRLGRHRGHARAGDRRRRASTSRCCSARPPTSGPGRNANELADTLRELEIDETWIHEIVRRKILHDQEAITQLVVRGARVRPRRADRRRQRAAARGLRRRQALHADVPAVAAAHRVRARRRPVRGHQRRQGLDGHRRDRDVHREGHPAQERRGARGRHHRHRHRLQPERARRHRVHDRRRSRSTSPTPSPIAG